jgi:hypothetical protein
MKKEKFFCTWLMLCIIFFQSCVGYIDSRKMDLDANVSSQQILNLRNYGDDDIDFFRQSEGLMKNGFLDTSGEEYGYYRIDYNGSRIDGLMNLWHSFLITIPYIFVGFPTDNAHFYLTARLSIYDSAGNLVKAYAKEAKFTQYAGLYYGRDKMVTEKAARTYSRLYGELFKMANMQSSEINQALRVAGPITNDNKEQALARISGNSAKQVSPSQTVIIQQPSGETDADRQRRLQEGLQRSQEELNRSMQDAQRRMEEQNRRWQEEQRRQRQEQEQYREEQRRRAEEARRRYQ